MTNTAQQPSTERQATPESTTAPAPLVVLLGNPNTGKTSLFNQLSGKNARVGNYPGITVERHSGWLELKDADDSTSSVELVDVPGTYSLSARSPEEQIALNAALGIGENPEPQLVVVVVDAGQLIRNLYLVLQLAELAVPMVIALNMIDEVSDDPPSAEAISRLFAVPCVETDARRGRGMAELRDAIRRSLQSPARPRAQVDYPKDLRREVDRVADAIPNSWRGSVERDRALALWALTSVDTEDELDLPQQLRQRSLEVQEAQAERDIDMEIIAARYAFLDKHAPQLHQAHQHHPRKRLASERVDRVLLHPIFGFAIFITLMLLLFQALFSWSDPAIGLVEAGVSWLGSAVGSRLPEGLLRSLVTEGLISGVGNVIVFLPQILLLFLFIGILEDSGYMARVAFLMDRVMRSLGLHGRAFVPMLSGFACAVPAIMATRTMERQRDRLLTMLVIPLMTCSARLPVYTLLIAALFPPTSVFGWLPVQGLLMVALYVFSIIVSLLAAGVLGRTVVRGRQVPLILELPPYRLPGAGSVLKMMWQRSSLFLKEAGTVILVCTVALWALLSFPRPSETPNAQSAPAAASIQSPAATAAAKPPAPPTAAAAKPPTLPTAAAAKSAKQPAAPPMPAAAEPNLENAARARALEQSYGGRMGKALEPLLRPLGFDWKIGVGIIGAFAAREVFISTMGLVYGVGEVEDEAAPLRERIRSETRKDGRPAYTPLVGLSLMVFFALACQCMSTLAVVRRETKTWRWPAFLFAYMTGLAYLASLLVFQLGSLLGF